MESVSPIGADDEPESGVDTWEFYKFFRAKFDAWHRRRYGIGVTQFNKERDFVFGRGKALRKDQPMKGVNGPEETSNT